MNISHNRVNFKNSFGHQSNSHCPTSIWEFIGSNPVMDWDVQFFVPGSPLKTSSFTTPDYRILLLQDTWKVKLERGRIIWIKIFPICHSAPAFMNYTTIQNSRTFSSIPEFNWQKTSDFSINEFESRLKQELKLSTTWYINISENSFLD